MNTRAIRQLILLAGVSVLTAFGVTYAWQTQRADSAPQSANPADVIGGWLQLPPGQVEQLRRVDAAFADDRRRLESALAEEQEHLAELFDSDGATDEAVLDGVERVIAAHDALERRVARYLLAVRPQLNPEQRNRLFERCAGSVRQAGNWRWRHGQSGIETQERRGGGPPSDRGFGRGRGRGGNPRQMPSPPSETQPDSRPTGDSP